MLAAAASSLVPAMRDETTTDELHEDLILSTNQLAEQMQDPLTDTGLARASKLVALIQGNLHQLTQAHRSMEGLS